MSNDKADATYHGHLDETVEPHTIRVDPGKIVVDGHVTQIESRTVPLPKDAGFYDLEVNVQNGDTRWVKVANVNIPKPFSQRVAEVMGATIGGIIVGAAALVGIRYLFAWLWGI